jgi:SAM-dependent methyltransferase
MSSEASEFISCRRTLLDRCLENVRPRLTGKVLDIGGRLTSRRGRFVPPVHRVSSWVIINLDSTEGAHVLGGLPHLPFSMSSFNVVICTEVLEYVGDVEAAVEDIARVLDPNGVAFISVPFLHRSHGDKAYDKRRFTRNYLEDLFAIHFHDLRIEAMGGLAAVIFDLFWSRFKHIRCLRPFLRFVGRMIAQRHDYSVEDCTGFFIVATKPIRTN